MGGAHFLGKVAVLKTLLDDEHTCMYACMYMYVCMYVCMYACMYVCTCTCMFCDDDLCLL